MHLYISNLPLAANESDLISVFSQYGAVSSVELLRDPPLGEAVVTMPKSSEARKAVDNLNLTKL